MGDFQLGPWQIDTARHRAIRGETSLRLSLTEVSLLNYLREKAQPVRRPELLQEVFGYSEGIRSRAVDAAVARLRSKLEEDTSEPALLMSRRAVGIWLERVGESAAAVPVAQAWAPAYATPYHPRPAVEAGVRDLLDAWPIVTLTGPGGVGKSRLANELSRHLDGEVVLVSVATVESASDVWNRIAAAARMTTSDPAAITAGLASRDVLCVLDEAETAIAWVCEGLEQLPGLRFLLTSRRTLGLPGEAVFEVPRLDGEGARTFVRQRLAASRWARPATDSTLDSLIEQLDGLPLALELAAAQSSSMEDVLLDLKTSGLPGASGELLSRTMQRSVDALSDRERKTLAALVLCEGPLTESEVVDWLGTAAKEDFEVLVDRSLLTRVEGGWRVLRVVRAFVRRMQADWGALQLHFDAWMCREAARLAEHILAHPQKAVARWAHRREDLLLALPRIGPADLPAYVWWLRTLFDSIGAGNLGDQTLRTARRRLPHDPTLRAMSVIAGSPATLADLEPAERSEEVLPRLIALQIRATFAPRSVDLDAAAALLEAELTEVQRFRVRFDLAKARYAQNPRIWPDEMSQLSGELDHLPLMKIDVQHSLSAVSLRHGGPAAALGALADCDPLMGLGLVKVDLHIRGSRAMFLAQLDPRLGIDAYLSLAQDRVAAGESEGIPRGQAGMLLYALGELDEATTHLAAGAQIRKLVDVRPMCHGLLFAVRLRQGDETMLNRLDEIQPEDFAGRGEWRAALFHGEASLHRARVGHDTGAITALIERCEVALADREHFLADMLVGDLMERAKQVLQAVCSPADA